MSCTLIDWQVEPVAITMEIALGLAHARNSGIAHLNWIVISLIRVEPAAIIMAISFGLARARNTRIAHVICLPRVVCDTAPIAGQGTNHEYLRFW